MEENERRKRKGKVDTRGAQTSEGVLKSRARETLCVCEWVCVCLSVRLHHDISVGEGQG